MLLFAQWSSCCTSNRHRQGASARATSDKLICSMHAFPPVAFSRRWHLLLDLAPQPRQEVALDALAGRVACELVELRGVEHDALRLRHVLPEVQSHAVPIAQQQQHGGFAAAERAMKLLRCR